MITQHVCTHTHTPPKKRALQDLAKNLPSKRKSKYKGPKGVKHLAMFRGSLAEHSVAEVACWVRDGQEPDYSVLWSPRKEAAFHSICNRKPWMALLRTDVIYAPSPYLNNSNN